MIKETVIDFVDRQRWLDPIADVLQGAITKAYAASGPAGDWVKRALSGTWLGHPLHPALTDVPVGAWTAAAVLDTLEMTAGGKAFAAGADAAVAIGLVGAVGSAVSGLSDWHYTIESPRRTGLAHGLLNISAAALYTGSLVARGRGARGWGRGLAAAGYGVAVAAAYLGGELVYRDRLGVDHAPEHGPEEFTAVLSEAELVEGKPRRVDVGGVPVMLARRGGRIFALGETCSHLGGPLAEGELRDQSVICPWHQSRFDLETGQVLDGPATFTQPSYQTRVCNGQIEVGPQRAVLVKEQPAARQEPAPSREAATGATA